MANFKTNNNYRIYKSIHYDGWYVTKGNSIGFAYFDSLVKVFSYIDQDKPETYFDDIHKYD